MQILIALSKTEVREMLAFAVESKTGQKPFEVNSARTAIESLADHGAIKIVICEHPGISDVLFRHIISLNRKWEDSDKIRVIVCSGAKQEPDDVLKKMNIIGYASWANLIDSTLALLERDKEAGEEAPPIAGSVNELSDRSTCRIKTSLLIRIGVLNAGIYIRLSPTKYLKIFQEGDEFNEEDYSRILREKKIEHLYLRRDECDEFLIKFKNDLIQLLSAEILTSNVNPELLDAVHETAQELLNKIGATREVQEVVKANIQLTIKIMGKSQRLSDILKRLEVDRGKYISSHSVLLPQVAGALAMNMDWKSDTTFQKLALAAFLHDIPLVNHSLAAITSLTELARRKESFSEEELKAYKGHPIKASELVKQFSEVPPDVDTIILQHHERPDGTGFPRQLTHNQISPLAAIFIVAHDIVSAIFDPNSPFVLTKFIEANKTEYSAGNFKKMHAHLNTLKL